MAKVTARPVVLLVEDHTDTRQMYAEFLGASFDVLQAADGQQALDVLARRVPAIVITDISLPGMDGFELIRRMRGNQTTSGVPVICLYDHEEIGSESATGAAGSILATLLERIAGTAGRDRSGFLRAHPNRSAPC